MGRRFGRVASCGRIRRVSTASTPWPRPNSRESTSIPFASDAERYRVLTLQGHVLRILGKDEAALPFLEQALDLANKMHDEPRTLHAMLALARIYTDSGNFDRAMAQLDAARSLANSPGR